MDFSQKCIGTCSQGRRKEKVGWEKGKGIVCSGEEFSAFTLGLSEIRQKRKGAVKNAYDGLENVYYL